MSNENQEKLEIHDNEDQDIEVEINEKKSIKEIHEEVEEKIEKGSKSGVKFIARIKSLVALTLNPVTFAIIGVFVLMSFILAGSRVIGRSTFNLECLPGGGSVVNVSEDADDFTRQSAIAAWLTSTHFEKFGGPFTKEQAAGVIGNLIQESAGGKPGYVETISIFNPDYYKTCGNDCVKAWGSQSNKAVGIIQWDGGRRLQLVKFAESQGKPWYDLNTQLQYLKKELDGTEGDNLINGGFNEKIHTPDEYAWLWNKLFERSADTPDSPMANKRRQGALDFFAKYKGSGGFTTNCTGGSVDTSNIVQLAISASYDFGDNRQWGDCSTAVGCGLSYSKPEYIEAKRIAEERTGADGVRNFFSSCDRFVATMLRASGMDPEFPWAFVTAQEAYMRSSPKWEQVSCQDRQPGDVIVAPDVHIMLYLGDVNGREMLASASYLERTAGMGPVSCNGDLWNADSYTNARSWRMVK